MWMYLIMFALGAFVGFFIKPSLLFALLIGALAMLMYAGVIQISIEINNLMGIFR